MLATITGDLLILGANTEGFRVMWRGADVPGLTGVRVDCDDEDHRVKCRVVGSSPIHDEMRAAGIIVKQEG